MACLFCSWLGLSSAGFSVSLLPAVLCLALHYCLLPLFALLLLAPLRVSKALPLRCLGLLGLFVSMQFTPGRSRVFSDLFSYSLLRCSSCLRCGSLWLCLSAVQALLGFLFPCSLLGFLFPCSLLLGFSAASSLPPFCAAPVASAAGLSAFPQLRLATSLISLALLLCLAVLRLMLRCLGLLRLLPSSSLCLVRVLLSFGRGLWLRSSCGYLFCPFSSGVFSFSTSSFGGFGLLHPPAYSSPSACSLGVPGTSVLPSSGVSMGWGVCIRGVLHRYCLRLL